MRRIEQEIILLQNGCPFTVEELHKFRSELLSIFGDRLDNKLKEFAIDFAENFAENPEILPERNRFWACKIFWMMKLIPLEPNQN